MSKYEPLRGFLTRALGKELPMRFEEIEGVLGFALPSSARSHPAWWSNSHHNPAVQAWRQAGWSTSKIDLSGQRVVFTRDGSEPGRDIQISLASLNPGALKLLSESAREAGVDLSVAAVRLLNAQAAGAKQRLLDHFASKSPKLATDSTALIREDRDGR